MQNDSHNDSSATKTECISPPNSQSCEPSTSSLLLKKSQVMATVPQNLAENFMPDLSPSDEEEVSEVNRLSFSPIALIFVSFLRVWHVCKAEPVTMRIHVSVSVKINTDQMITFACAA